MRNRCPVRHGTDQIRGSLGPSRSVTRRAATRPPAGGSSVVLDGSRTVALFRRVRGVFEGVAAVPNGRSVVRVGHTRAGAVGWILVRKTGSVSREVEARELAAPIGHELDGVGCLLDGLLLANAKAFQVDFLRYRTTPLLIPYGQAAGDIPGRARRPAVYRDFSAMEGTDAPLAQRPSGGVAR